MAVLTDPNRTELRAELMRIFSHDGETVSITKPDLLAAINGLDDYVHTNAAAINTAIPQPARGALTTAQKARLLAFVVLKRYTTGT
jgi:molybdopterin-guanine dinucleotide biosynthesis protein